MLSQQTLPSLTNVLCDRLIAWRVLTLPMIATSRFAGLRDTIADQDRVRWQAALEGMLAIGWANTQQQYYKWIGSRKMEK
jgi:hypothetical protein